MCVHINTYITKAKLPCQPIYLEQAQGEGHGRAVACLLAHRASPNSTAEHEHAFPGEADMKRYSFPQLESINFSVCAGTTSQRGLQHKLQPRHYCIQLVQETLSAYMAQLVISM